MNKIFASTLLLTGLLAFTACDSYLDINTDPNSPSEDDVTSSQLMPAAEMNLTASYGDYLRITGGYFAQQYAQDFGTSNYLDYSQFSQSATRSSSTYTQLNTRVLTQLNTIRSKASASEEWGTYLAATTLRAFTYQALVDCYGEVPYTEAGSSETPHYDEGQTVYDGIVAELDSALDKASSSDVVCTNFLYNGETAENWIKFAKALKLRILTRESDVKDVSSEIKSLIDENDFPTADVAYSSCWANESGQMSPFYAEEFYSGWGSTQVNVIPNIAVLNSLIRKDSEGTVTYTDPRISAWIEKNAAGNYTAGVSGTNFSTSSTYRASYFSRPVASYDMPVYLITLSDIDFYIAEYYAREGDDTNAEAYYNMAVEASFATAGVDGASEYLEQSPYDSSNWQESIGDAKWLSLFGTNPFEAWCELRRLDYPAFGSVSGSDITDEEDTYNTNLLGAFTLYTPVQVFGQVGENQLLERWPYAESSSARNTNTPDFPGYTSPVFWAE
jgi:hypothetical protein